MQDIIREYGLALCYGMIGSMMAGGFLYIITQVTL